MTAPTALAPRLVHATVVHRRHHPVDYAFEHPTTAWLVDAADPNAPFPRWLRGWMRIRTEDHLGEGPAPLVDKVRVELAEHGSAWSASTVLVLVGARTAGHVFDPLTSYFCFDATGRLEGVLAEVHNTYGGRHCYLLPADDKGTDAGPQPLAIDTCVEKAFYVSPFFTVAGRYDIRARLAADHVAVAIRLTQDGRPVFTGSVAGPLVPATRTAVLKALLRDPFGSRRVSALIRWHGVRLWARRLPVVPRPPEPAAGTPAATPADTPAATPAATKKEAA